jgi:hypothetical protein
MGQVLLVLLSVFAPDEPRGVFDDPHWTEHLWRYSAICSLTAGLIAIFGIAGDKRRDAAQIGLSCAFIGLVWPVVYAFGTE